MNKASGFGNLREKLNQAKQNQTSTRVPNVKKYDVEVIDPKKAVQKAEVSKADILELVDKGMDMVISISNTVAAFQQTKQAKERTKQVEWETRRAIHEEEQKTARLKLELEHQLKMEQLKMDAEMQRAQQEMERIRSEIQKSELSHELAMKMLDSLEKNVEILRQNSQMQLQSIQQYYANNQLPPDQLLNQLNQSLGMLVNLSRDIISLRQQQQHD
jgi:hypothetical protein